VSATRGPDAAAPVPLRVDAGVVRNDAEGGDNFRLRLAVPGWPGSDPGQFVMLSPGPLEPVPRTDPLLPRPMAVYRTHGAGGAPEVEILYKVHGRGTRLLAGARPGDRLSLVGPLGRGFPDPPAGAHVVLVGGGTGVASLYDLARRSRAQGLPVSVLLGARRLEDLMGRDDFEALGVDLRIATEDGSSGHRGLVTELLEALLADPPAGDRSIAACGPTPMMRRCHEIAAAAGEACRVALENRMACGFGVCLGCAAPLAAGGVALVCRDGPVLPAAELAWEAMP